MPRLSPDGKWIAVSYQGMIGKISTSGGTLTVLSAGESWDTDPAWSPDGTRIVYVNSTELQIVDAVSGATISLAKPVPAQGPLWFHPDGRRLLGNFGPTPAPLLAWLDLNTCQVTPLALGQIEGTREPISHTLSADGRWVFFAVSADKPGEQKGNNGPRVQLLRVPAAGGAPERIVRFPARIYGLSPGRENDLYVVTDAGASHNDLWHLPIDNPERGARKVTFGQADESWPSLDPSGSWLVYADNSAGTTKLIRQSTATGDVETIPLGKIDHRRPTGAVDLRVIEGDAGEPTVARVSVKEKGGKFHAPAGALYRIASGLGHFYARGAAHLELPAGRYELRAFRGQEYRAFVQEFEIRADELKTIAIHLKRWTDAPARGWYSGENHIHANLGYGAWYSTPESIIDQCEGEDLHVSNIMVANSGGEGVYDREFFTGRPHPLSTGRHIISWNQEFRGALWGHITLFNLTHLIEPLYTGFRDTTNPWDIPTTGDMIHRAAAQGGVASYTHPTMDEHDMFATAYSAKGLPVDAALGIVDTIDVMGMGFPQSTKLWYRLLNCGFRIPGSAGTDCFLNRVRSQPPGWGRVYVHLPGGLSYEKWVAGVKAGRSFVSNGPMIEFSAGTKAPGETLTLNGPARVRVHGRAESPSPLQNLEVIYNGEVVASGRVAGDKLSVDLDQEILLDRSGWIALRTSGPGVTHWVGGRRSAHSNPIYVEVSRRPLDGRKDAAYFVAWIDRLEAALRQRDRMHTGRTHIEAQLNAARAVYRDIIIR